MDIAALKARDVDAWARAFPGLRRIACSVTSRSKMRHGLNLDAGDLTQDLFVRAWENIHRFDERMSLETWLFVLAKRYGVHRQRTSRDVVSIECERAAAEVPDQSPTPDDRFITAEEHARAEKLLGRLTGTLRGACRLTLAGLEPIEIARQLGINLSTASMRLTWGKRRLADIQARDELRAESRLRRSHSRSEAIT
jgi:RNA polymerase sigma factor (sigma-70 family)